MPTVDRWVIARTLATLAQHPAALRHIDTCAINLSGPSLDDDGLLDFVQEQLSTHGIAPQLLCFEITETSAIASLSSADRKSTRLNSSHLVISYAVFCLKKKKRDHNWHASYANHT